MTLPGSPHVAYRGDSLFVDDCRLEDLALEFGTPLYVYSQSAMQATVSAWQCALTGHDHLICYAMKANSSLAVLQTFIEAGCGFDIVSGGELERVLAAGADPSKVVFSGIGKTRPEMLRALEVGVACFNVESEAELNVLSELAAQAGLTARISVRVNPDVDANTHPYISTGLKDNKFGIAHQHAVAVYQHAATLPGIEVVGIACHIGSQITDTKPYLQALDRMLDLVEAVESFGQRLHHLDLGGGLGITYIDETPPSPEDLVGALLARIHARGHGHRRILFEPGRSLVGNAGVLVSEVLFLKPGETKNFCIVDAAMNDLIRPAMYEAWMRIVPCRQRDEASVLYDVVGPVCESSDWLGRDRALSVKPKDLLAVLSAGAYCMSMASNYNSRGRPAEVMVNSDQVWLIRERESSCELFRGERFLPRA